MPSAPTATGQPGQCQTTGGSQCCSQLLAHPRRWGIPCLNCSGHSRAPPHTTTAQWHRPAPTQCGEDATENSRLSGNPRDQTGTHSCCARARLRSQIPFPLPFLTAARFQLHPAALSQALQAHGALLLHGYNSQPYTQTGLVFNFLINTLYIKEKGLQFAVSTQRARGKRKKKKEKERLKNLNHKGQRGEKGLKLQSQIPMSSGIPGSD